MSPGSIPATVIVLTHNEAGNIVPCLQGLRAFAEIIVVDSGSTDGTLDLVQGRFPHIRVLHHPFQDFGQQRNWALDHACPAHDWILFLDADERCTASCAVAIRNAVASPGDNVGFFLCYRNMFLGRWIRRSTMYPTWQLRLLNKGRVRYVKEGHGQREVMDGPAGYIDVPYDHFGFGKGIKEWIARHNDYSTNEVELLEALGELPVNLAEIFANDRIRRHRTLKRLAARAPLRPFAGFVYLYFIRLGCLDGYPGFVYCCLRLAHELHIQAKHAELRHARTPLRPAPVENRLSVSTESLDIRSGGGA